MEKYLNEEIEKFYLSILDYAGLEYKDNIIKNKDSKLGDITIDGKNITIPYFSNLRNNNVIIFHPLNENYVNPEISTFNFYRQRLTLELNLRLSYLIVNLIVLASDVQLQQNIKSSSLLEMISSIGETDMQTIENFYNLIKVSKKRNNECFIFNIFLKKNGSIGNVPYSAIGKIDFILPKEIEKALDKESNYRVYDLKLRKKDIIALNNIFNILFPDYRNEEKYGDGTDNKVFRYLSALLKTSYIVAKRINEVSDLIKPIESENINLDNCYSNMEWIDYIENLQNLTKEIRAIPNNYDRDYVTINKLNESKANVPEQNNYTQNSINTTTPNNMVTVPYMQTQELNAQHAKPLTPEEIIKNSLNSPYMPPLQQFIPQQFMYQQNAFLPLNIPRWALQEAAPQSMNTFQQPINHPMNMFQQPIQQPINTFQQPINAFQQPIQSINMFQQPINHPMNMFQQPIQQPINTFQQPIQPINMFQQNNN